MFTTIVTAITAIFSALPEIIKVIKSLIAWIQLEQDKAARKDLLNKFSSAIDSAVQTNNTSDLENLFKTGDK